MDYAQLKQDFKDDMAGIPQLKIPILSAQETYLPIVFLFLKCFFSLLGMTFGAVFLASLVGIFTWYFWPPVLNQSLAVDFLGSVFITFYLSQYIMFANMVKAQLKTTAFLQQKVKAMMKVFCGIYFALVTIALIAVHITRWFDDRMITIQSFSVFIALFITLIIFSMEVERLGLGAMFEVVTEFFK